MEILLLELLFSYIDEVNFRFFLLKDKNKFSLLTSIFAKILLTDSPISEILLQFCTCSSVSKC